MKFFFKIITSKCSMKLKFKGDLNDTHEYLHVVAKESGHPTVQRLAIWLARLPRECSQISWYLLLFSVDAKGFIDKQMRKCYETTNHQIQKKLAKCGLALSSSTIQRSCHQQSWTMQRTAYCQLIRDANIIKRLESSRLFKFVITLVIS